MLIDQVIGTLEELYCTMNIYHAILVLHEDVDPRATLRHLQTLEYPVVHIRSAREFVRHSQGNRYRLFLMVPSVLMTLSPTHLSTVTVVLCESRHCYESVLNSGHAAEITAKRILACLNST
jgi:hypothetical protein